VYLEGSLARALGEPVIQPQATFGSQPKFEGPAHPSAQPRIIGARPILNPFLVYAEGEDLLRQQLHALSRDQLVNIVRWYNLPVVVDLHRSAAPVIADDMVRSIHDARRPERATNAERRAG
jgi:hypothetical protein